MRVSLTEAAQLLTQGNVVAVPTETVYGLGASLNKHQAIESIFSLKGRPANNPLIIHASSAEEIMKFTKNIPPGFDQLASSFWPGPMTLVLPADENRVDSKARAGLPTAAFRIPGHPTTLALLKLTGPLVMPSANLSGKPSATSAEHVEHDFGSDFPVLDGGKCLRGVESTILIFVDGVWRIIRQGAIPAEAFQEILGYMPIVEVSAGRGKPLCPGQLYRHYAPKAKLVLTDHFDDSMTGAVVGFRDRIYPKALKLVPLGSSTQPKKAAEHLYAALRQLDEEDIPLAYVDVDVPQEGLWLTILERLKKAAQP